MIEPRGPGEYQRRPFLLGFQAFHARKLADGVAWFEFAALCEGPRGAADYIELARTHHTVLLSRVPKLLRMRLRSV